MHSSHTHARTQVSALSHTRLSHSHPKKARQRSETHTHTHLHCHTHTLRTLARRSFHAFVSQPKCRAWYSQPIKPHDSRRVGGTAAQWRETATALSLCLACASTIVLQLSLSRDGHSPAQAQAAAAHAARQCPKSLAALIRISL